MKQSDVFTRIEEVEQLGEFPSSRNYVLLTKYLADKNELVRISALESMENYTDFIKKPDIAFLLNDPSTLVRGYAIELYAFFPETKDEVIAFAKTQRSVRVKLGCYFALYNMGEQDVLPKMFHILHTSRQYRIRITTAHMLSRIISPLNKSKILDALRVALVKEKEMLKKGLPFAARAAESTLEKLITDFDL